MKVIGEDSHRRSASKSGRDSTDSEKTNKKGSKKGSAI
jgi:hypothetical protein